MGKCRPTLLHSENHRRRVGRSIKIVAAAKRGETGLKCSHVLFLFIYFLPEVDAVFTITPSTSWWTWNGNISTSQLKFDPLEQRNRISFQSNLKLYLFFANSLCYINRDGLRNQPCGALSYNIKPVIKTVFY